MRPSLGKKPEVAGEVTKNGAGEQTLALGTMVVSCGVSKLWTCVLLQGQSVKGFKQGSAF